MTDLHLHIGASALRVAVALVLSVILALPAGIAAGRRGSLNRIASPIVYLLYPIPKIALLPLFVVLLGLGESSKIALLVTVLVFPVFIAARDGVRDISPDMMVSAQTIGLRGMKLLRHVLIPALLPRLFSTLRLAIGIALSVLFFAESFATEWGLGSFIMNQWAIMHYEEMVWGVLAISILGFVMFKIVDLAEYLACPWSRNASRKRTNRRR